MAGNGRTRPEAPMTQMLAVVQLANGIVTDLPDDTQTFDVPELFRSTGRVPAGASTWCALSSRGAGEEFLLHKMPSVDLPERWLLFVREPDVQPA